MTFAANNSLNFHKIANSFGVLRRLPSALDVGIMAQYAKPLTVVVIPIHSAYPYWSG